MEQYKGRAIVQKIAAGRIWFYTKEEQSVKRYRVEDTEKEWKRYEAARDEAVRELKAQSQQGIQAVHFELKIGIDFGERCAGQVVSLSGELSGIESAGAEKN